ncbi:MAG: hypothetical protein V7K69_02075 [Nostoc sp.]
MGDFIPFLFKIGWVEWSVTQHISEERSQPTAIRNGNELSEQHPDVKQL